MVAATLSPARALRRPRRTDPRSLIGIFLTLAALAGSISFWVSNSESRPVLVATRDLPIGATVRAGDLSVAYVRMDDNLYRAALSADMLDSLVGRQLGEPMHAQQVLARAQVSDRLGLMPDQVAITIPAAPMSGDVLPLLPPTDNTPIDTYAHLAQTKFARGLIGSGLLTTFGASLPDFNSSSRAMTFSAGMA